MALISQPGSDYQLAEITLDAGTARDITCLLLDVHAVLDHLYLDGTQPKITAPAEGYLLESSSPYTLPALIGGLDDAITQLTQAMRDAVITPPAGQLPPLRLSPSPSDIPQGGAKSEKNLDPGTTEGGARSKENTGASWG
jgi:hypothetical protein